MFGDNSGPDSDNDHENLKLYKWKKTYKFSGSKLVFEDLTQTDNTGKDSDLSRKDLLLKYNTLNSSKYVEQLSNIPLNLVTAISQNVWLNNKITLNANEEENDDDGFEELK